MKRGIFLPLFADFGFVELDEVDLTLEVVGVGNCELDTEEGNVRKLGKCLFVGVGHFITKNRGNQLEDLRIFCLVSLGGLFWGVRVNAFAHCS